MHRSLIDGYVRVHSGGDYGLGGRHFPVILPHVLALKPKSLVDYGAGRSRTAEKLGRMAGIRRVARFDPGVPEISARPEGRFDLLISTDVLEHVPEAEMDAVLAEMASMADNFLHIIDIKPAKLLLADGRNAHVSLHDEAWWHERLAQFMPGIQPFRIRRPNRVAFKTWNQSLPAWRSLLIERREFLRLSLEKRLKRGMVGAGQ